MAEITIRDLREEDYGPLSQIIDDEWRFHEYSERYGLEISEAYLLYCANGAHMAKTILVDGEPCGVVAIGDMPGDRIDLSEELGEITRALEHKDRFDRYMEDNEELHRIYLDFASTFKRPEWAELKLLILSDRHKGLGLGRKLIDEACRCASEAGMEGLFFYTDTECNVGFYDHIGAVCIGYKDTLCAGEPIREYGYYLDFKDYIPRGRTGARLYRLENIERIP
jgi:GNAT superfamily N-acetyltransferase